ncbi:hypothetical protein QZH41_017113 [Actinostola sp. cb2023]|nr:hypothetical protein QZH41_017113 [Actinostola sp. cb2023]
MRPSENKALALRDKVWIAMEFVNGRCLHDIAKRFTFSEQLIATVIKQCLSGLAFIHRHGYIHSDIKSHNILVSIEGKVQIADFGLVTKTTPGQKVETEYPKGSLYWLAPETIRSQPFDSKIDIWSLGIVCIEMIQRNPPTFNLENAAAIQRIAEGYAELDKPTKTSRLLRRFLYKGCLRKNPNKRLSAEDLLQHSFIQLQAMPVWCLRELMEGVMVHVPPYRKKRKPNIFQRLVRRNP